MFTNFPSRRLALVMMTSSVVSVIPEHPLLPAFAVAADLLADGANFVLVRDDDADGNVVAGEGQHKFDTAPMIFLAGADGETLANGDDHANYGTNERGGHSFSSSVVEAYHPLCHNQKDGMALFLA
jgi:hypothetical protein